jgi:hypothetical protein
MTPTTPAMPHKISNHIKGLTAPEAPPSPPSPGFVTHGVTQTVTQGAPGGRDSRRRARPRSGGPYLLRRGATWYFRKRVSGPVSEKCTRVFFCISLRTHLLLDATVRAAALLVAFSKAEEK